MALKLALCLLFVSFGMFVFIKAEDDLHEIISNFARKLMKAMLDQYSKENLIISPYAVQRLVMVVLQAAKGPLYDRMQAALEIECIGDVLADGRFKNYPAGFHAVDQIFYNAKYNLSIPYILIAKILFNVSPEAIDVRTPKSVSNQINSFVKKGTIGLIRKIVNNEDILSNSSIYFTNAIYFEGHWDITFDKGSKRFGKFFNYGTEQTVVSCLYAIQFLNYGKLKDMNAHIIELPYKNTEEKLLIVLPLNRQDLKKVQEKIFKVDFQNILKRMKMETVSISLPTFELDYRTDLSKILPSLGMGDLFAADVDLRNGFDVSSGSMTPTILHKTYFDINDYGTVVNKPAKEAGDQLRNSDSKAPDIFFIIEHPFLFFLHTEGTIHFVGNVQKITPYDD